MSLQFFFCIMSVASFRGRAHPAGEGLGGQELGLGLGLRSGLGLGLG